MKKRFLALFSIFVIILAFFIMKNREKTDSTEIYSRLAPLEGVRIEELRGSHFLLHFWAKWCEPCAEEIPGLLDFAARIGSERKLKVLAVSLDPKLEDSLSLLPDQGKKLPSGFLLALDPDHRVAESLGSWQYPETYLVDPAGKILEKWVGPQKWQKAEVLEYFRRRLP